MGRTPTIVSGSGDSNYKFKLESPLLGLADASTGTLVGVLVRVSDFEWRITVHVDDVA